MYDKIAHTAEHAFIGALQHRLGRSLQVRKVEHSMAGNTAFIVIAALDLQTVLDAQTDVNDLIEQGLKVIERKFGSLEESKKAYPDLRANEERISGEVRVIEIESHDVAACAMDHAVNLRECDFFLVTRISKNAGEYEVDFVVGRQAKAKALSISASLMRVCNELGANINTVENTARKLKKDEEVASSKLRFLGMEKLAAVSPEQVGKYVLLKGVFTNLDDDQLVELAGKKVAEDNAILLLANSGLETAKIVFARNEKACDLDCNALFKRIVGQDGRGGGKPHFVVGVLKKDALSRVMDEITEELAKQP